MSTIVKLVQGSPEWHEHRLHHRNASETPAVLGVSPWTHAVPALADQDRACAAAGRHGGDGARHASWSRWRATRTNSSPAT